jgi:hypothetical protein
MSGMESLGEAIAQGKAEFNDALNELTSAHIRLFGTPRDLTGLQERISRQLLEAYPDITLAEKIVDTGRLDKALAAEIVTNELMADLQPTTEDYLKASEETLEKDIALEFDQHYQDTLERVFVKLDEGIEIAGTEHENGLER